MTTVTKKKNKGKCLLCGDIIESKYRHDFVSCSCEACTVDGGFDYHRFIGDIKNFEYIDEDLYIDEGC